MTDVEAYLKEVQVLDKALRKARRSAESTQKRRDSAIRRAHDAGASYRGIAEVLGVAHNYVFEICTKEK